MEKKDRCRQMRIIVLYDLPTLTKKNRKDFHTFHKYLLRNGYYMLQFSVYVKLCHTFDYAQESAQKLEKNCPKSKGQKKNNPLNFIKLIINKKYKNIKIQ